jgi:hypothetical protein
LGPRCIEIKGNSQIFLKYILLSALLFSHEFRAGRKLPYLV